MIQITYLTSDWISDPDRRPDFWSESVICTTRKPGLVKINPIWTILEIDFFKCHYAPFIQFEKVSEPNYMRTNVDSSVWKGVISDERRRNSEISRDPFKPKRRHCGKFPVAICRQLMWNLLVLRSCTTYTQYQTDASYPESLRVVHRANGKSRFVHLENLRQDRFPSSSRQFQFLSSLDRPFQHDRTLCSLCRWISSRCSTPKRSDPARWSICPSMFCCIRCVPEGKW